MSAIPPEISAAMASSLKAQNLLVEPTTTPAAASSLTKSLSAGLPPIAISPAQGQHLAILCRMLNAKRVLEIGTLGGYSTLWFAGSSPDVQVMSLEVNPKHRDVALANVKAAGEEVSSRVEVLLGDAMATLPTLKADFDFVFIDADWERQDQYFEWAVKLTRTGGCVYVDNALRQITETEAEGDSKEAMALPEKVAGLVKEGKVWASLIPTLNTHKETLEGIADGYIFAIVL